MKLRIVATFGFGLAVVSAAPPKTEPRPPFLPQVRRRPRPPHRSHPNISR